MTITRQDAWTQDEDLLLAEVVLRHIREGGTQLSAFEEVGRALTRTAAACGFRWNSFVRKQYQSGIELAKKQRKELRKQIGVHAANMPDTVKQAPPVTPERNRDLSIQDVIQFLEQFKEAPSAQEFHHERERLTEQVNALQKELEDLRSENQTLRNQLEMTEEDYKALIDIMDRARKMVVSKEDGRNKKLNQGSYERI
ncbi:sporulation-specific transcriptional regulator GerR [Bacillus atrophaeus]|uniref:sporulation-specific transcriptional regulator GerR n=1 Tax=Bacillus atrophaeus TaxID=1452 RepID=UPI0022817DB2|nr:sporulation-specific transcriptional regulator GerR [Bacillus atrophaeus]MCY8974333.1 sporulation-specific transcriptional regulator GerR [Bacillus atrophaeus]